MKIVVDTNIVISGLFFGGKPRQLLLDIVNNNIHAYVTNEILNEYQEIIYRMIKNKKSNLDTTACNLLIESFIMVDEIYHKNACRDKDDNKFINCALSAKATYIISGDNDLLILKKYENIEIISVDQFYKINNHK